MSERHTRQNRFAGTPPGGRYPSRSGGKVYVEMKDMIAAFGCWCGEEFGHDWPGKAEGKSHPTPEVDRELFGGEKVRAIKLALQEMGVCPACCGYPKESERVILEGGAVGEVPWCGTCLGLGVWPPPKAADAARHRKAALAALTERAARRERLTDAVLREIVNVSNLPDWMQTAALGRNMRGLAELVADAALGVVEAEVEAARLCGNCHKCLENVPVYPGSPIMVPMSRMILCSDCGNKRCPKASDHRLACTGSNEPGQPGSVYGGGMTGGDG